MNNPLLVWRKSATQGEWKKLAELSGTSPGYLNLVAYGYRRPSPRLAMAIETASKSFSDRDLLKKESLVFLLPILR